MTFVRDVSRKPRKRVSSSSGASTPAQQDTYSHRQVVCGGVSTTEHMAARRGSTPSDRSHFVRYGASTEQPTLMDESACAQCADMAAGSVNLAHPCAIRTA
jgi:hypothetical protein